LCRRTPPELPDVPGARIRRGAFVTLVERETRDLRGCIGHVKDDRPLGEVIRQVAVSAARRDARFPPVEPGELAAVQIEISVLGVPVLLESADPGRVVIGRDGLLLRRGAVQAVLLPQVATENGFGPEDFLDALCRKAGLRPGSHQEPGTRLFTFTADVFVE